jgi:phosphotransferase system  glucose/maltose/N-acetylglucosamine-specific IIC component
MKRNTLNLTVDLLSLVVLLALACTGLIMAFVLPPGSGGRGGLALWGMGRHDWGEVHLVLALALIGLLLVHVPLHWSWVCCTVRRVLSGRAAQRGALSPKAMRSAGLATVVAIALSVGGFYAIAKVSAIRTSAVSGPLGGGCKHSAQRPPWDPSGLGNNYGRPHRRH